MSTVVLNLDINLCALTCGYRSRSVDASCAEVVLELVEYVDVIDTDYSSAALSDTAELNDDVALRSVVAEVEFLSSPTCCGCCREVDSLDCVCNAVRSLNLECELCRVICCCIE